MVNYHSFVCSSTLKASTNLYHFTQSQEHNKVQPGSKHEGLFLKSSISFYRNPCVDCRSLQTAAWASHPLTVSKSWQVLATSLAEKKRITYLAGAMWEATTSAFLLTCHKRKHSKRRKKKLQRRERHFSFPLFKGLTCAIHFNHLSWSHKVSLLF